MGFASEILFILILGWLVLGPKQLQIVLRHVARARNKFDEASRSFRSLITAELGAATRDDKTDPMRELSENQ